MKFPLLPRMRVNYTLADLIKALFVRESSTVRRDECESILSDMYEGRSALLTPSSRNAIYELLIRLPQKKVLIPSYTCMVVNEAVYLSGKKVIYAKSDLDCFNSTYLDKISSDCIVIATHQYGLPCNIQEVANKCHETGAILIEDCATSMGSKVNGRLTGTFGDYAVISFNASKTLNVPPSGGVLISKDTEMIENIRNSAEWSDSNSKFKLKGLLRGLAFVLAKNGILYRFMHWLTIDSKGKLQRTEHEEIANKKTSFYKNRFAEWQASILLRQLKKKENIFMKRKEVYAYYNSHINNNILIKPTTNPDAVCTRYAILTDDRRSFYKKCLAKGIDMDFSHCSIGCPKDFDYEHSIADRILNLPFYYDLSEKDMKKVVKVVNSIR